jgi:ABC-type lipoprotein release transport system permease subunit
MRLLPMAYAVRNLLRDPWRLVQLAGGSALVTLLLLATGGFSAGMRGALAGSGDPANTILMGAGSEGSIERSALDPATAGIVAAGIDGLRMVAGTPAVSPEIIHMTLVEAGGATAQATLRGITPMAFAVHRGARLAAGVLPQGDQILAGRLAHRRLGLPESALQPGAVIRIEGRAMAVSGIVAAPGTIYEGELWMPLEALMSATRRTTISTVVVARAEARPADIEAFAAMRLDLELSAIGEADYYADRGRFFAPIRAMAWLTALLIAAGAVFGGLNTYHAAFAARRREAATVLAIGFPRRAVLISFVTESTLVSTIGTVAALLIALLVLDGAVLSVPGGTFALDLDAGTLALGLGAGLALGPLGALLPAWHCLSSPLPNALRSA